MSEQDLKDLRIAELERERNEWIRKYKTEYEIDGFEKHITALKQKLTEAERELAELMSNDTPTWKSAAFQKIKGLEKQLSEAISKPKEFENENKLLNGDGNPEMGYQQ